MHEAALAQSLVELVEAQARAHGVIRIARVIVEIGALSDVEPHALQQGYEAARLGTIANDASLDIETPAGEASCFGCGEVVTITRRGETCPRCGSAQLVVLRGDHMRLKAFEAA
jgi:hydrogenase nickel incorporation protein HypA/HybF